MRKIVQLISIWLLPLVAIAADSSASPFFQLRLVLDAPSDHSKQMVLVSKGDDGDHKETLDLQDTVLLDETALSSATATTDVVTHDPCIEIRFNKVGTKRFAQLTRQNIGNRLAIIIGGRLYCAPVVRSEIPGGEAVISGSFTPQEARALAAAISAILPNGSNGPL
jgi:preprotein translocase subunit SecD